MNLVFSWFMSSLFQIWFFQIWFVVCVSSELPIFVIIFLFSGSSAVIFYWLVLGDRLLLWIIFSTRYTRSCAQIYISECWLFRDFGTWFCILLRFFWLSVSFVSSLNSPQLYVFIYRFSSYLALQVLLCDLDWLVLAIYVGFEIIICYNCLK